MALVVIQSRPLTREQKQRIGERIIAALHQEGLPASSTVLLFQREERDILLDGLLVEAGASGLEFGTSPHYPAVIDPTEKYKTRARRTRSELSQMKEQLLQAFQTRECLDSFSARRELGIQNCEWAVGAIRRLFRELEREGLVVQQGQKRGTRYVLKHRSNGEEFQPAITESADRSSLSASSNF